MTDRPEDDLSPSLGGDRATEAPPVEPEARRDDGAPGGGEAPPELEALLAELGQGDLAEALRRLGPLLGGLQAGRAASAPELEQLFGRGEAPIEELFSRLEPFSQEVAGIVEDTVRLVEERLPPTLAAFEGLFDAIGQVFQPLFEEPDPPGDGRP